MPSDRYHVGFTVGTFDLFHMGHLNLLRQARERCDRLVVGVHTDEWVVSCKGHAPIVPYDERAAIVSAIRYVDAVVPNESLSKLETWRQLHFDVALIGEDWRGTDTWNRIERELGTVGCSVIYLPRTPSVSSTERRSLLQGAPIAERAALLDASDCSYGQ